jgi:uncharacterized coiled-coil DUF342 family protein
MFTTNNYYYFADSGDNKLLSKIFDQINLLKSKLEIMAKTQLELAEDVKAITAQLQKVGNESAKTLQKVEELQAVIDNLPNVTPELQTAFDELKTQAKVVDDLVPDAIEPPPPVV